MDTEAEIETEIAEKLFDWKRSGGYAWKACFPLSRAERSPLGTRVAEGATPAGKKAGPLAPPGGKP